MVRLIGHSQHNALTRTGGLLVILHTRAAARGIHSLNHQRNTARVLQYELSRPLLSPVEAAHVSLLTVNLRYGIGPGRFLFLTAALPTDDFQVEFLDLRIVDGVADGQHTVVLVKQERLDELMELQAAISLKYNESRIGGVERVLVDSCDVSARVCSCRSSGEAPEVDGEILLECQKGQSLPVPGEFVDVRITGADEYDLNAELI